MPTIKPGDRVRLKPWTDPEDPENKCPEEFGVILSADPGFCTVRLDEAYRVSRYDDGIREVPEDQVELVSTRRNIEP